jgi:exodeoxyribonuclease VII large subunit
MSEKVSMHGHLCLSELNDLIKKALVNEFPQTLWIAAEIMELKINQSGHCYLELVEKDRHSEAIIARNRAIIWSYTFRILKSYFETTAGRAFAKGIKVLLNIGVEFHSVYGLSLNVHDIDPVYTLGDIAQKKQAIIDKLKKDGVFAMNKELELPLVPQKVAVISSPTAAGYEDFIHQLQHNSFGIKFYTHLFPAVMQGEKSADSIIHAFEQVFKYEDFFDVVVLIRGGGAQAELTCFDDAELAFHITQFSLPVITGIGHEKDESIADMVAHTCLKTPTAVAEFLIGSSAAFLEKLAILKLRLNEKITLAIHKEKKQLHGVGQGVEAIVREIVYRTRNDLQQKAYALYTKTKHFTLHKTVQHEALRKKVSDVLAKNFSAKQEKQKQIGLNLRLSIRQMLHTQKQLLHVYAQKNSLLNPQRILERGYSLSFKGDKLIRSKKELAINDRLTTCFSDGEANSIVIDPMKH